MVRILAGLFFLIFLSEDIIVRRLLYIDFTMKYVSREIYPNNICVREKRGE